MSGLEKPVRAVRDPWPANRHELADRWRLAQAKTMIDYYEAGRLDSLPLDAAGKIVPTDEALHWAREQPRQMVL